MPHREALIHIFWDPPDLSNAQTLRSHEFNGRNWAKLHADLDVPNRDLKQPRLELIKYVYRGPSQEA